MGVTIHWELGQGKENVKSTLDYGEATAGYMKKQAQAIDIPFEIKRRSDSELCVDIGGCESLLFNFQTPDEHIEGHPWREQYASQIQNCRKAGLLYANGFCKTQYCNSLAEHRWVAEILRAVASRCEIAEVSDEGNYYHTGRIEDAAEAIGENGKLIDSITGMLAGKGFSEDQIIVGGITKVKGRKDAKHENI